MCWTPQCANKHK